MLIESLFTSCYYRFIINRDVSNSHALFNVSNLRKCLADENLHIPLDAVQIDNTMHFVERPIKIMDREIKQLKWSNNPIVKVLWESKRGPEFTWEREDQIKAKYPHLFVSQASTSQP
jgi:hypothetical protein